MVAIVAPLLDRQGADHVRMDLADEEIAPRLQGRDVVGPGVDAVEDRAVEEKSDRREPDVRMGPDVHAPACWNDRWPHVVEEHERPDHLASDGG